MAKAAIVYNPISGSGAGEVASIAAEQKLRRQGFRVERIATRDRSGATPIARQLAHQVDLLVVVGGDGSIREAIAGLEDATGHVDVGLVPTGNANVICRELGIPLDRDAAIGVLASGCPAHVDLGSVNGELFLAMVGIGWDALTVARLERLRHSKLGRLWYHAWADSAYAVAGLAAAFQRRPPRVRLSADGRIHEQRYCAAVLCNFHTYGKGWCMVPEAHFQSGKLHFQARKRSSPLFVAWQVGAAMLGRRTPRFVSDYGRGERLVVECERSFPVQADGDFKGYFKKLELSIQAAAVRILVPLPYRAAVEERRTPRAAEPQDLAAG